jgi:hypothetical protein
MAQIGCAGAWPVAVTPVCVMPSRGNTHDANKEQVLRIFQIQFDQPLPFLFLWRKNSVKNTQSKKGMRIQWYAVGAVEGWVCKDVKVQVDKYK